MKRKLGLNHIEAFRAVVLTNSMTEAARRLHTSQPQVSRLIAQLEEIAQFRMFDRSGGRLTTTLEGARFFQEVEKTFTGLAKLEGAADNIRSFRSDRLRVTAMPRLAGGLLTRIAADFLSDHPGVEISIRSGTSSAIHDWVRTGLCDLGIAMLYNKVEGIQVETVAAGNCVAIVPQKHELARKRTLKPSDFKERSFIASPSESPLALKIDEIFLREGVRKIVKIETDLGASVCGLVGAGAGLSLINPLAANEEKKTCGIAVKPFKPDIPFTIALVYPPFSAKSLLVEAFSQTARKHIEKEMRHI